jgi:hypothetical protein
MLPPIASFVQRVGLVAVAWAVLVAGSSAVSYADEPLQPGTVTVTGDVRQSTTLTLDALAALPSQTQSVTFETSSGPQSHTYVGAKLADIVNAADLDVDRAAKHPLLPITILALGADGYSAAVAWGEIAPELAATPVLVAYTEDGASLDQPRLVVPGDREGSRYVSQLVELRIVDLARR